MRLSHRAWPSDLAEVFSSASDFIFVASPFVTGAGIKFLTDHVRRDLTSVPKIRFITNLSPANLLRGATDPVAFAGLEEAGLDAEVVHLPNLHSKIYVADRRAAVVTSANLTSGGLYRNAEYGVYVDDDLVVSEIVGDLEGYSSIGAIIPQAVLQSLGSLAERLQVLQTNARNLSERHLLQDRLDEAMQSAQDDLARTILAGDTVASTFARTILYLLHRHGPLTTEQLQPLVRHIHPDLCDDTVDRVIDGQAYGKKWKHAVRSAQQQLKSRNEILLREGHWQAIRQTTGS